MNDSVEAVAAVTNPVPLRTAVWLLTAQAIGLIGVTVLLLWLSLTATETSHGAGLAEAVVAAGVALLLGLAARSLHRGHATLRGAAIFVELMFLPLGYYLAQAGLWWFAVPAWVLGLGTAVLLVVPSTRESVGVR